MTKRAMVWTRSLVVVTAAGCLLSPLPGGRIRAAGANAAESAAAAEDQRALLDRYCVTCHNERSLTAGLALDTADVAKAGAEPEVWERVIRKLRLNAMPPPGRPRPDAAATQALVSFLKTEIDQAAAANPNPGRVDTFHRLNRAEYKNAIRDLLLVDVDVTSLLPADDSGLHGFDNMASMLSVSPTLIERYLSAAKKISRVAVGVASGGTSRHTYQAFPYEVDEDWTNASDELPFGSRGGLAVRHTFPVDATYEIMVRLRRNGYDYILGSAEPHQIDIRIDGVRVGLFTVGGEDRGTPAPLGFAGNLPGSPEWAEHVTTYDDNVRVRIPVAAGARVVGVSFVSRTTAPEGIRQRPGTVNSSTLSWDNPYGNPAVENIKIDGPYDTSGVSETPSRLRLFVCRPEGAQDEVACAREILSQVARRAYRRPVTDAEVDTLVGFFEAGRGEGFDTGIELALERVLTDPNFLFRIEQDPEALGSGTAYRLSDLELASRLSFFLWSSIPDDELLELAARERLHEPATLAQQVRRMVADPRASALVENFAGQWLQLRNLADPSVRPGDPYSLAFDENLRQSFIRETELFFDSVVRENRSVLDLLDADYTYLNERLATHYGIPNVLDSHFRRVALPADSARRGILGQGSILTLTSHAIRTSPVLRGKWILNNVLGTPPPDPPPNVPALADRKTQAKTATMRERMRAHRDNPACAACHAMIDPAGFALEHFDAIGRWRDVDESYNQIDASGTLPDGTAFDGAAGLRQALTAQPERFVTTVTEKLLTYALGRGIEYYDMPAIRRILRETEADGYPFQSIILGIVRSEPFLRRAAAS